MRRSTSRKEEQFASDIKQLLVERHSLKRKLKGNQENVDPPDIKNVNPFKRGKAEEW